MRIGSFVTAASAIAVVTLIFSQPCLSQTFKVGDRVEASPLSMDSKWEPCEVIQVMQSGDHGVVCGPRRTEYAVQGRWVRPLFYATSRALIHSLGLRNRKDLQVVVQMFRSTP